MSDSVKLPEEFAELQAFADVFAISDDVDRDIAERLASPEIKRIFVDMVWPLFDVINNYLNHHDDESAHLLGGLAEAAAEIAIDIGRPAGY